MAKKATVEEDPMYRKICTSSKNCSAERKTRELNNMSVTLCAQCFQIFEWEPISINKKIETEKPKDKKPEVIAEAVVETVPVSETKVVKSGLKINKVQNPEDEETAKKADAMKQVFAEVDGIMEGMVKPEKETKKEASPFDDPFEEEEKKAVLKQEFFEISNATAKSSSIVRLVSWNKNKTNKWIVDVETEPAKVAKIVAQPEKVIGKTVKVEFMSLDAKDCPMNPVYLGMGPKPQ